LDGQIPAQLLVAALEAHIETLKAQLRAAEARAERLVADFAERDARHAAELAIERTLADHMSARVDQLTAELAAERSMAEKGLTAELARAWWKPRLRRE
jgi:predicted RNase H-like nuclease (RuvC/YqgF family)